MISTQVQAVLDRAKQSQSLVQSVDLGMQALRKQVSDLQAQIAALQPGNTLDADDISALSEAAGDLDASIATLQSDIPANTPAAGAPANSSGAITDPANPGNAPGSAPASSGVQGSDGAASQDPAAAASQHQADSDAAAAAKPLAGTGAPAAPPTGSQS